MVDQYLSISPCSHSAAAAVAETYSEPTIWSIQSSDETRRLRRPGTSPCIGNLFSPQNAMCFLIEGHPLLASGAEVPDTGYKLTRIALFVGSFTSSLGVALFISLLRPPS